MKMGEARNKIVRFGRTLQRYFCLCYPAGGKNQCQELTRPINNKYPKPCSEKQSFWEITNHIYIYIWKSHPTCQLPEIAEDSGAYTHRAVNSKLNFFDMMFNVQV